MNLIQSQFKNLKSNRGFSLVELMVVVAIIGILATIAIPNYQRFQAKTKQSEGKNQLSAYFSTQSAFKNEWQIYAGEFLAAGFRPNGKLNYRVSAASNDQLDQKVGGGAGCTPGTGGTGGCIYQGPRDVTCNSTKQATCTDIGNAAVSWNNEWLELPAAIAAAANSKEAPAASAACDTGRAALKGAPCQACVAGDFAGQNPPQFTACAASKFNGTTSIDTWYIGETRELINSVQGIE